MRVEPSISSLCAAFRRPQIASGAVGANCVIPGHRPDDRLSATTRRGRPTQERTIDTAKFMYLYRGPRPHLTPDQAARRMATFAGWIDKVGPALVDGGSPFGLSASVRDERH